MSDDELKAMVDAFLAWPLPDDVCSDAVACKPGAQHRTGTNLLTATQARAMFEHCLAVVRAHDRDGEIGRLVRRKLASGNGVPVERCHITAKEVAAIDAAMRAEG